LEVNLEAESEDPAAGAVDSADPATRPGEPQDPLAAGGAIICGEDLDAKYGEVGHRRIKIWP